MKLLLDRIGARDPQRNKKLILYIEKASLLLVLSLQIVVG
jgi:hypothetical protein